MRGISVMAFLYAILSSFQLLLHACGCQPRPGLWGASDAGSTFLVWLRFWREAQRRRMSSEFTQGYVSFSGAVMETTETWSNRTLLYITAIDPDLRSCSDGYTLRWTHADINSHHKPGSCMVSIAEITLQTTDRVGVPWPYYQGSDNYIN